MSRKRDKGRAARRKAERKRKRRINREIEKVINSMQGVGKFFLKAAIEISESLATSFTAASKLFADIGNAYKKRFDEI